MTAINTSSTQSVSKTPPPADHSASVQGKTPAGATSHSAGDAGSNALKNSAAVASYQGVSAFDAKAAPSGKGSTEGAPATDKQPLNLKSVQAADHDYDKIKNLGAATTAGFVEMAERHKDDPDYLAELVNRAKDPKEGVLDTVMGPLNGAFQKDPSGNYAGFSDEARQAVTNALQAAHDKGYLTNQEIRDHAANSPGWQDVAQRLGVTQAGHDSTTDAAVADVKKAQDAYDSAHGEVAELDERLQQELSKFGSALDEQQRAAYVNSFQMQHKEAYEKETKAAETLDQTLQKNLPTLERASITDPSARTAFYKALTEVASSPTPLSAVKLTSDLAKPENGALREAFSQYKDFEHEVAEPATRGVSGQLLAENGGDPKGAFAELKQLMQPVIDAGSKYGSPGWELFKSSPAEVKEAWAAIGEASEGKYDKLKELGEGWGDAGTPGGLAKGLASAGLSLGLAALDAKGGIDDFKKGEYVQAFESFAKAGQSGLEIAAGTTKALADAGKLAEYTDTGLSFAKFATKLAPVLGLAANSAAFLDHLHEAGKDGGNVGFAVSALGDAIGVMGSAIELVPGAEPVGALFGGIGAGVSAAGELLGNFIEDGKIKAEERQGLQAAGLGDLANALVNADAHRVQELSQDLKLSPSQVQELVKTYPGVLEGTGHGVVFDAFKDLSHSLGLGGNAAFGLLEAIGQGAGNKEGALEEFLTRLQRQYPRPQSAEEWTDAIHTIATDPRNADTLQQVFANADRFLSNLANSGGRFNYGA